MPAVVAKSKKKPDMNAAVSENIHNLAHSGKNHNKRVKAQGKAGAHKAGSSYRLQRGERREQALPEGAKRL